MTIKKCNWQSEVNGDLKRWNNVNVNFINSNGQEDEVQFSIKGAGTKAGLNELSELFSEFCKENGFKTNTVTGITIVEAADSFDELN